MLNIDFNKNDPLLNKKRISLGDKSGITRGWKIDPRADFDSDQSKNALSILRVIAFDDVKNA